MRFKAMVVGVLLASCGHKSRVEIINGTNGSAGHNGANGHSLVSQYVAASELECSTNGQRLDIFLDIDDNLRVSDDDIYQASLLACNGLNGLNGIDGMDGVDGAQGEQGPRGRRGAQGPRGSAGHNGATGATGAQGQAGPSGPAGPRGEQGIQGPAGATGATGASGSGASISNYTSSSCTLIVGTSYYAKAGSNGSIYDASGCSNSHKVAELSNGESFWVASNMLAVDNNGDIRVIKFN